MLTLLKLAVKLGIVKLSSILRNAGGALGIKGRTVGGGLILLLMGAMGIIVQMWPELAELVPQDMELGQYLETIAAGLIGVGVAGKFEKGRAETATLNKTLEDLVTILGGNAKITQQMVNDLAKYAETKIQEDNLK